MRRYLERVRPGVGGKRVHVESPSQGLTLCGVTVPGEPNFEATERGKISCGTCLQVIRLCKGIRSSRLMNGRGR